MNNFRNLNYSFAHTVQISQPNHFLQETVTFNRGSLEKMLFNKVPNCTCRGLLPVAFVLGAVLEAALAHAPSQCC